MGLAEETAHSRGAWGRPQEGAADTPHPGSEGRGLGELGAFRTGLEEEWPGEKASEGVGRLGGVRSQTAEGREGQGGCSVAAGSRPVHVRGSRPAAGHESVSMRVGGHPVSRGLCECAQCPERVAFMPGSVRAAGKTTACGGGRGGRAGLPHTPWERSVVLPSCLRCCLTRPAASLERHPLPFLGNNPRRPGPAGGGELVTPTLLSSARPPPALLKEGCRHPA